MRISRNGQFSYTRHAKRSSNANFRDDPLFLRLLTRVGISVRCLLMDGQFNLLVWLLLSLLSLFSYSKHLILQALAISISAN